MYTLCEEGEELIDLVRKELLEACYVYPAMVSAHEGMAIILEEVDELKEIVWKKPQLRSKEDMRREAVQIAAMALRFIFDVCQKPI